MTMNQNDFPVTVTLRFRSEEERRYFMGQLSDGWGESEVELSWNGLLRMARECGVVPTGEHWEHHKRMRAEHPDWFEGWDG